MSGNWASSGKLTADGKSLEYACWGPSPSDAPTIVLLHEGLGCTALWRDFPEKLSRETGFGVMAYSRAGYGQSDLADLPRPLDYMTHEAVNVLPEVLHHIGFQRGILAGHSDGATIAMIYAGSVSDMRVRGVIAMAPHFFTEEMGLQEIANVKTAFETGEMRERMAKYHRNPEHTFKGWNDVWLDPAFRAWNVGDVIDHMRIPMLAIQGRQDQYGTLAQIEEMETRAYSPVNTAILDDCRHAPFVDQQQKTLIAITSFCTQLERLEAVEVETV